MTQKKMEVLQPCTDTDLRWIQITASVVSLLGVAGLLAILAQGAWAEDAPKGGFKPGQRTFSNPFANQQQQPPQGTRPQFFDDTEDDDGPEFDVNQRTAQNPTFANPAARPGSPGAAQGNAPVVTPNGISAGGTPPGGVVSHKQVKNIDINSETGDGTPGSKEIVTDFNFPDADILDIAKTLGKLTGKNFILDKDVKGRITIISNSAITVGDAWKAFLTALDINGFALIPSGNYIRIARQRDARDKQLKTYTGDYSPDTDALITRVFPLKYIDAEEVARTFRSFMPANSRIIPYEQTNTVIVTDTGSNISKLSKMLEILDVEGYDLGIEVIPVKFASAAELSKLIDTLLPGTGPAPGTPPGIPRFGGGGGGRFNARRTKEGGVINTIISDERTNTLIINANSKGADQVRELVAKLDQKLPAQTGGGKVHVVYLQFADSEQIAATLNNLSSQTGGGFKTATPGLGGTGVNPVAQTLFEGAIKVASDKATNSLVITASPSDFVTVQRVINRLDIPRDEVFVEVVILEVSLNSNFSYSANIASPASTIFSTTTQDLTKIVQGDPSGLSGLVIPFKAGAQTTVTIANNTYNVPGVLGLIKAIQTNSKANVLSTPQIIALDNSEANFESTEKIPVPVSTAVQGAGVSTSIQNQNVSLSIKIKPQINKLSNFVKLDVTTKLGDISDRALPPEVATKAFAILERTAQTTVVVGDSDTVVIGGLIRDKVNDTITKIPLLGDIPILGWLFRAKNKTTEKTNLLVFLTPHIVRQYEKVRAILDKKLKERDDFIEKNAGGEDPMRDARDNMIRSLPDVKEFSKKRETTVTIDEEKPAATPVENGSPFTGPVPQEKSAPAHPQAPSNEAPIAPPPPPAEVPSAPAVPEVPPTAPPSTNSGVPQS